MKRTLTLVCGLMVIGVARAQIPPAVSPNLEPIPAIGTPSDATPVPAILGSPCHDPIFGLDLLLGMMSGVRAEGAIWHGDHGSLRLEGFYGATLTKFGSAESAGAGLRWNMRRQSPDGCHAVVFGPGCDVLFHLGDEHLVMLAPTVELAWHRTINNTAGWILGLNAGIGVGVSGRDTDGDDAVGRVTPLISGFFGFRY